MRGLFVFSCLIFTALFFSCTNDNINSLESFCRIIIQDTISYNDFVARGNFSFYNLDDETALGLFDQNRKMAIWQKSIDTPLVVDFTLRQDIFDEQISGAYLRSDSIVAVLSRGKIVEYDFLRSKIVAEKRWNFMDFNSLPPYGGIIKAVDGGSGGINYVIRTYNPSYDKNRPEFFEKTNGITCVDMQVGLVSELAYFEEGSVYRANVFPSKFNVVFEVKDDSIYYLRPFDRGRIYVATCQDGEVRKIGIDDSGHTPYSFKGSNQLINPGKVAQVNSIYLSLLVRGDQIYTQYREAVKQEEAFTNSVEYSQTKGERKSFVDVYNRYSGEKKSNSIEVPACLYKLIDVTKGGELVFTKRGQCTEQLEVYKCIVTCEL
jgi:hypothetical protein